MERINNTITGLKGFSVEEVLAHVNERAEVLAGVVVVTLNTRGEFSIIQSQLPLKEVAMMNCMFNHMVNNQISRLVSNDKII